MKFKPVPEAPENLDFVRGVQYALPLVPGVTDDCCARVMRRVDIDNRDVAATWLTFLRALELAEERDGKFVRRRREPERDELAQAFQAHVYGASRVLDVLSDETRTALGTDAVFEEFSESVPIRGKEEYSGVEAMWRERIGDMLDWAVLLGLAERTDDGYVRA